RASAHRAGPERTAASDRGAESAAERGREQGGVMREFIFTDLSESLLRACWQGGVALGLAWGVCRVAPRISPRLRCWLWRLAYLNLLVAFLWLPPILLPALPAASRSEAPAPRIAPEGPADAARADGSGNAVESGVPSARFPLRACLL